MPELQFLINCESPNAYMVVSKVTEYDAFNSNESDSEYSRLLQPQNKSEVIALD